MNNDTYAILLLEKFESLPEIMQEVKLASLHIFRMILYSLRFHVLADDVCLTLVLYCLLLKN